MIPATVIAPWQLQPNEAQVNPGDFGRHYACEGDSWASFGSVLGNGIVHALEFPERVLITSLAAPGDTLRNMATRNEALAHVTNNWALDGLLLSAGGNDLIDALPHMVRAGNTPRACIDWAAWRVFVQTLHDHFDKVVALVDGRCPVYIHTYDFPTPRPAGAVNLPGLRVGPWLLPALAFVPEGLRLAASDLLFKSLRTALLMVQGVTVVDTAGTLDRALMGATGESGDWINEIHPTRAGYRKLAPVWERALAAAT